MLRIPFPGSKFYSYKNVKKLTESGGYTQVFEPFGGSAVLSVNLYNDGVVKRAVINDYDHLWDKYPKLIAYKYWVVSECLNRGFKKLNHKFTKRFGKNRYYYLENGKEVWVDNPKLSKPEYLYLQSLIKKIPKDYWKLLTYGANFTFGAVSSHKQIHLRDFAYFKDYINVDKQQAYLRMVNKLERASLDWKDFIKSYQKRFNENTLIIADPPYCDTYQDHYTGQFTENDTLKLLESLKDTGCDFIFFNHNLEKTKYWLRLTGITPEKLEYTGLRHNTANHNRLDVLAYVRAKK